MTNELFEAYLDAPFSELAANDLGRDDARRLCFEDFGIPVELIQHVWDAGRESAQSSQQGAETFVLRALVAAGHVSQAKVDEAFSIAAKTPGVTHPHATESDRRDAERMKALWGVLMCQVIETSNESYLALRCVGVPPTEDEFALAINGAIDAALSQTPAPGGE